MLTEDVKNRLVEICAEAPGTVEFDVPLSSLTTIGIGGSVDALFRVGDEDMLKDLKEYLDNSGVRCKVVGKGSNILFPDGEMDAVIILLSGEVFENIAIEGKRVVCGAGAPVSKVISVCASEGLSGMEGLIGIPGTIGGTIFMNASYKTAVSDNLITGDSSQLALQITIIICQ